MDNKNYHWVQLEKDPQDGGTGFIQIPLCQVATVSKDREIADKDGTIIEPMQVTVGLNLRHVAMMTLTGTTAISFLKRWEAYQQERLMLPPNRIDPEAAGSEHGIIAPRSKKAPSVIELARY